MLPRGIPRGGDPVILELPADAFVDVLALGSATWIEAVRVPGLGRELLEGVDTQAGAAFEAWLLAERRHAAGLSAAVLREAATARLATGSAGQAIELATKLVAFDEFDEEANALLIRAYVAMGAGARAQAHLDATAARFRRELGTEPSATLTNAIETAALTPPAIHPSIPGAAAAGSLITAGEAAVGAGVLEPGLQILRRAVVDAHEAGEPALEARALVALGTAFVHGARGRDGEGAIALHAALRLAEELSAPEHLAEASRELGYIEMKQARYERDARTRCVRIPDAYLWIHAYCLDALCEVAIQAESPQARAWVGDLETLAARTGMNEMLVRAQLHRAALGDIRAGEAARLFADRIDNPAVLRRVTARASIAGLAVTPS